jgi:hypothetical protein
LEEKYLLDATRIRSKAGMPYWQGFSKTLENSERRSNLL